MTSQYLQMRQAKGDPLKQESLLALPALNWRSVGSTSDTNVKTIISAKKNMDHK